MPFLCRCDVCASFILFGGLVQDGLRLCSHRCRYERFGYPEFCPRCKESSTDNDIFSGATSYNGMGSRLSGPIDKCSDCGSETRTHWKIFLMFHLRPIGTYRMIPLQDETFLSRGRPHVPEYLARVQRIQWLIVAPLIAAFAFMLYKVATFRAL
jgi:hypothetical protein